MKTIHYCLGLPRSGSTLLMNLLQQNPLIFTSSTCPTPYLLNEIKQTSRNVSEFIALDQDILSKCLINFVKHGKSGWYDSLTDKPIVISKSRLWLHNLNFLLNAYDDPKIIVTLRDLREIIVSYEKLLNKYPMTYAGSSYDQPFELNLFEKRMEILCTDTTGNLGLPLNLLPHLMEWVQKKPKNFFLIRFEDFNDNPIRILKPLYEWLGLSYHEHDFNNIKQSETYEHDTVYRALVSHKVKPKFERIEPLWPKYMTSEQSEYVIKNNFWYYKTFYPEYI